MNRMLKKILLALMAVFLLMTSGCAQSDEQKLRKLEEKANKLIETSDYQGAIDIYRKALEDGLSSELVMPLITKTYTDWSAVSLVQAGGKLSAPLDIIDQMIETFPETKTTGEGFILDYAKAFMNAAGDDIAEIKKIWEAIVARYYESDEICYGVDDLLQETAEGIIDRQTDAIIDELTSAMDNDDFNASFERIDEYRKQTYTMLLNRSSLFPYVRKLDNGKTVIVEYVNTFFSLYYGDVDSEGKRSGEGRQIIYAVNYSEADKYIREYMHGQFANDMVNGEFEEVNHVVVGGNAIAYITGKMVDNKYDGEIKSQLDNGTTTREYTFTFHDGLPVALGRLVDFEDYYAVGTTGGDDPHYFGYKKASLDEIHGFYPYYNKLH